ncbi:MAG: M61 family peptidase [Rhodanobacter sp.]
MRALLASCSVVVAGLFSLPAIAGYAKAPIDLAVTVSAPQQHIFRVTEKIPVTPGPLTLYYPKWIPGEHAPRGPISSVAGLFFHANGKVISWQRDPEDMYTFHVDIPKGANSLTVNFDLLPASNDISLTPRLMVLEWNEVALYPADLPTAKIEFRPSLTLPSGWQYGTALVTTASDGDTHTFAPVTFNNLVDSPVMAGMYFRQVDLSPGNPVHHYLDMVADYPQALELGPKYTQDLRNLIEQANRLFDSRHYDNYHFLLSLSDETQGHGGGLEHHQSSDNRLFSDLFLSQEKMRGEAGLLPHEYVHSWNGKFRRPDKLWQPDFEQTQHPRMLWVYEGLTNYWGDVLAARSGLSTAADYRATLAYNAATMDHTMGRQWRPLIDTTVGEPMGGFGVYYGNWHRGGDYYPEGALIWLGVDTKIRELTDNKRSLDDFAKKFYGMDNGSYVTKTYTFDDVVTSLNSVAKFDWASYLSERLDKTSEHAPLSGISGGGWKLVYSAEPNAYEQARGAIHDFVGAMFSVGLTVDAKGTISDVLWNGPAFKAGLAPGMTIVAVNGTTFSSKVLLRAIAETAEQGHDKLTLTTSGSGITASYTIDYAGGPRYPHLERVDGKPDYLSDITAPAKG